MTPTGFVTGLAQVMAVGRTEIATVDRALAKDGCRKLSRGRSRPNVTLHEGVQIVCAWAGAKKLTEAAAELARLEQFHAETVPADEYGLLKNKAKTFADLMGGEDAQLFGMPFLDLVCWTAQQLHRGEFPADKLWVSVEKGGVPEITCAWEFSTKSQRFQDLGKLDFNQQHTPKNVKTTVGIRGTVLRWIYDVTEVA